MNWKYVAAALAVFVGALLVIEICAHLILYLFVTPKWTNIRSNTHHYYVASTNKELAYELKPSFRISRKNRHLSIGPDGLRETVNRPKIPETSIGVIGDSIVFGVSLVDRVTGFPHVLSDEKTIPSLLQRKLSGLDLFEILNLGIPGYSSREIAEYAREFTSNRHLDMLIYVLNANDFVRRDTLYEGADNGLYRIYAAPKFVSRWMLRKIWYRWIKDQPVFSTDWRNSPPPTKWYKWLYAGTNSLVFEDIKKLNTLCRERNISLIVLPVPPGSTLENGFALSEEFKQIEVFLQQQGISFLPLYDQHDGLTQRHFDSSNHLTGEGNAFIANAIYNLIDEHYSISNR